MADVTHLNHNQTVKKIEQYRTSNNLSDITNYDITTFS